MEHESKYAFTSTTDDLLARLNLVMNQSTLVREIVDKSEQLWTLEQSNNRLDTLRKRSYYATKLHVWRTCCVYRVNSHWLEGFCAY